jgi:hypothetical protein
MAGRTTGASQAVEAERFKPQTFNVAEPVRAPVQYGEPSLCVKHQLPLSNTAAGRRDDRPRYRRLNGRPLPEHHFGRGAVFQPVCAAACRKNGAHALREHHFSFIRNGYRCATRQINEFIFCGVPMRQRRDTPRCPRAAFQPKSPSPNKSPSGCFTRQDAISANGEGNNDGAVRRVAPGAAIASGMVFVAVSLSMRFILA